MRGKLTNTVSIVRFTEDHPRACGENFDNEGHMAEGQGSPPRVRGKPHPAIGYLLRLRITPARAGKTL